MDGLRIGISINYLLFNLLLATVLVILIESQVFFSGSGDCLGLIYGICRVLRKFQLKLILLLFVVVIIGFGCSLLRHTRILVMIFLILLGIIDGAYVLCSAHILSI